MSNSVDEQTKKKKAWHKRPIITNIVIPIIIGIALIFLSIFVQEWWNNHKKETVVQGLSETDRTKLNFAYEFARNQIEMTSDQTQFDLNRELEQKHQITTNQLSTVLEQYKKTLNKIDVAYRDYIDSALSSVLKGNLKDTEYFSSRALQMNESSEIAYDILSYVYNKQGNHQKSVDYLNNGLKKNPNSAILLYDKTIELREWGQENQSKYQEALDAAITLTTKYPNIAKGWNECGLILFRLMRYSESVNAYLTAINIDKSYQKPYNNLGQLYYELGAFDRSVFFFDKAIAIDPYYQKAIYNEGLALDGNESLLASLKYFDMSIAIYESGYPKDEFYEKSWYHKAIVLAKLNRFEESLDAFNKTITINPNYDKAKTARNIVLDYNVKNVNALSSTLLELEKNNSTENLLRTAELYINLGMFNNASHLIDNSLQSSQNNIKAMILQGKIYHAEYGFEDELKICVEAQKIEKTNSDVWNCLGRTWYAQGINLYKIIPLEKPPFEKYLQGETIHKIDGKELQRSEMLVKQAIVAYNISVTIDSNNTDAWLNMAQAYMQLKLNDQVVIAITNAIKSDPNIGSSPYIITYYTQRKKEFMQLPDI